MAPRWNERPKTDRFAIIGAIVGMAVAAYVAFNYAYDSDTIVRYLIMSAGLLAGGGAGFALAKLSAKP